MRTRMQTIFTRRATLGERFNSLASSETPLRKLAGDLSKVAKYAIDEANSLSLERVTVTLSRLPTKLDGFKIIHLSDISPQPVHRL